MRISLIKPPEYSKLNFGSFSLAVVAAAIKDMAEIMIVDATDLDLNLAVELALKDEPEMVGVTAMGLSSVGPAGDFINALRAGGFRGSIVVGGHGATMSPKTLLMNGADAVVCGEGEITFRELLREGISQRVAGLALMVDGKVVRTSSRALIENLDGLKEPAWDQLNPPRDGVYLLETSRGCPHGCTFCETTRFYGRRWRARSPEIVARDVARLVESRGAMVIQITDDNFTSSPKRAIKISQLLKDGPLPLFFLFFARTDDILKCAELPRALAEAHFLRATIGIETLAPEIASSVGKPITFPEHKRAIEALARAGIFTVATFIVGLPGETEEMRRGYVDSAVEIGVDSAYFLPFQPLPGTPLERGNGTPEDWCLKASSDITNQFENHPLVLQRLLDIARLSTVRGMIARSSLLRRLEDGSFDNETAAEVAAKLSEIDSDLAATGL